MRKVLRGLSNLVFISAITLTSLGSAIDPGTPPEHPDPISNPEEYASWKHTYNASLESPRDDGGIRREMDHTITNGYVAAVLDESSGEFDQGGNAGGGGSTGSTSGYVDLTYSWPSSPGTEWVMYKVDGYTAAKTSEGMPSTSRSFRIGTNKAVSEWDNYHGVKIRQELTIVSLGGSPGENEQCKFETFITPADGSCHNVGCIVYYDTKLNGNDGAPISTSFGYSGIATTFFAPDIPSIWRAYEGGTPPSVWGLQALGILTGFEAVMPDVFWYGRWPSSVGNGWADSEWTGDSGGGFSGDSATMVKWYQRNVCPGDTIRYCTYYGIGELTGTGVTLNHEPPDFTSSCASGVTPNPFHINAMITNAGASTATGVIATLGLGGTPLTLSPSGDPNPRVIGSLPGYGGTILTDWVVNIPPSAYGTTQCYTIQVNYDPGETILETYCIDIPAAVTLSATAYADDDEICAPECTILHAVVSGTATGPYTYSWSPTTGLSNPSIANPTACPATTTTYTVTVTAPPDCIETASVTINAGVGTPFELPADTICAGESTTLTPSIAPSGATYAWSTGATTPTLTVSPSVDTDYWVTMCQGSCCHTETTFVAVAPPIILDPGTPETICAGDTILLGGTPTATGGIAPLTYVWSPAMGLDNPFAENPNAFPSATTTYTVTVTDAVGCFESNTIEITVDDVPEAVTLVYPPDGTIDLAPAPLLLDWNPVSDPTARYNLYIDGVPYATGLSETEYIFPIDCDEEHTWYVEAVNWCGAGPPSETWAFATSISPSAPVLLSPADGTMDLPPDEITLSWEASTGTDPITYEVWVNGELIAAGLGGTEYVFDVECDSLYEWYVTAQNICDTASSVTWTFEGLESLTEPVITYPEFGDTIPLPGDTLHWIAATGGEPITYNIFVNGDEIAHAITDTFLVFDVHCDSTYDWFVEAVNPCGPIESDPSYFEGPVSVPGPSLIYPEDGDTSALPGTDLVWSSVVGYEPVTYTLFVNGVEYATGLSDTSYYLDVECDSTYRWAVSAENICGPASSEEWIVNTNQSPTPPNLIYPADGDTVPVPEIDLTWHSSEGSEPLLYDVYLDGDLLVSDLADTFWTIPTWCDESYTWSVVAHNMCSSAESDEWAAYGPLCGMPELTLLEPLDGTWSACDDQRIFVLVEDIVEIDEGSVRVSVNGVTYTISDTELYFSDDTLIFESSTLWSDGEHVEFCLDSLANIYHVHATPFCSVFDVDLKSPVMTEYAPTVPVVTDAMEPIHIVLVDSLSGLDPASIELDIDGTTYTLAEIEHIWEVIDGDSVLTIDFTSHPAFVHNDTVDVCISSQDAPDYCAANAMEECFSFIVDLEGPFAENPIHTGGTDISDGDFMACGDHAFCFTLDDSPLSWGIAESTVVLSVAGTEYTLFDDELSLTGTELCFTPESLFTDGFTVDVELVSAEDIHGNSLMEPFAFSFTIDMSTPYITDAWPEIDAFISDLEPVITFDLFDDISGTDYPATQICISVSGGARLCFTELDAGVTRTTESYEVDIAALGIGLSGGNTVEICVEALDLPDICAANVLDTCWSFMIPEGGPMGRIIEPLDGTYSACDDQAIHMRLIDAAGDPIDEPTIELQVNSTVYTTADSQLTFYAPDSLVFTPSVLWTDGEVVNVSLLAASDILGNELSDAPVSWSFTIDLSPPEMTGLTPTADAYVSDLCPTISFDLMDDLSGLDESSVTIEIEGTIYVLTFPDIDWDGSHFSVNLCSLGLELSGGDTVDFRLIAGDDPNYCAPNVLDTIWHLFIPTGGPNAMIITPEDSIISACDPQEIRVRIVDPEGDEIDDSTVELCVDGTCFGLSDPELSWEGDELVFTGGAGYFTSGGVIEVELRSASDVLGNPLENVLEWIFTLDYEGPIAEFGYPGDGSAVSDISPVLSFYLFDIVSGTDSASVSLTVDGVSYTLSDPALYTMGDSLYFDPDSIPIEWAGGDVIDIELYAHDSPTAGYCDPNETTETWSFSISSGGPVGTVIRYTDSSFVACNPADIVMYLIDPDGDEIADSTIIFAVNGIEYGIDHPYLTYEDDTLRFSPDPDFFSDGDVVTCELRACEDVLRNPLDAVVTWIFTIDYTAPVFSDPIPSDGADTTATEPVISLTVEDGISGINTDCLEITVDGVTYDLGSPAVSWDGTRISFDPSALGISWEGGDVIEITVNACDSPDYCDANTSSFSWDFFIPTGGPLSTIIEPLDSTISACEDQEIIMQITDEDGVDASTVRLSVDGTIYSVTDDELEYTADQLIFTPPADFYTHGQTVEVILLEVYDNLGNFGDRLPMRWVFTVDFEAPELSNESPTTILIGSSTWQTPVTVDITDDILGVDASTIEVTLENLHRSSSITIDTTYAGLSFDGLTLTIEPSMIDEGILGIVYQPEEDSLTGTGIYYPEASTINITVNVSDNEPDYCSSHLGTLEWSFEIHDDDAEAPVIVHEQPEYVSTNMPFDISVIATDTSSLSEIPTPYLIWDTDGELDADNRGRIDLAFDAGTDGGIWLNPDGTVSMRFTTVSQLPAIPDIGHVVYRAFIYDDDFDFMRTNDRSQGEYTDSLPILAGPEADIITPQPGQVSACSDQGIIVGLTDENGVDWSTAVMNVGGIDYDMAHPWTSYDAALGQITFQPEPDFFANEEHVIGYVTMVLDSLGNPMWDTLHFDFYVDREAPEYEIVFPTEGEMLNDRYQDIDIDVFDNLAGVNPENFTVNVNGVDYVYPDPTLIWDEDSPLSGRLTFIPENGNITFLAGDTVRVRVTAGDDPDLCDANMSDIQWWFTIEPTIQCYAQPNPFTPNLDGYNDRAIFGYPFMFSEPATIKIFTRRKELLYEKEMEPIAEYTNADFRAWDGRDNNGKEMPVGLYIYIIEQKGEVICQGTITLIR